MFDYMSGGSPEDFFSWQSGASQCVPAPLCRRLKRIFCLMPYVPELFLDGKDPPCTPGTLSVRRGPSADVLKFFSCFLVIFNDPVRRIPTAVSCPAKKIVGDVPLKGQD